MARPVLLIMETMALMSLLSSVIGGGLNVGLGLQNQAFNSETGRYNRLVSLGMNPNLAMASVAGLPSQATAPAQFDTGSVNQALRMMMDAPQMKADVNFTEANTDFVKSQKLFTDMQSFILPLEFQDKVRLTSATIDKYKSEGKLFDSEASYWSEMAKWVEPMSQAQVSEMNAHALEMQENLNLIKEKVRTEFSQRAANYASANSLNANPEYLKALQALTNEQTLTQENITQMMAYDKDTAMYRSIMAMMDKDLRTSINSLPIPDDAKEYFVLASMFGDTTAKQNALDIVDIQGEIDAAAYESQQEVMLHNWGKTFLNGIAGNSGQIVGGIATGATYGFTHGMVTNGGKPVGVSGNNANPAVVVPKGSPSGTSNGWKLMGLSKHNSGKVYKKWLKPNGEYYYEPVD